MGSIAIVNSEYEFLLGYLGFEITNELKEVGVLNM